MISKSIRKALKPENSSAPLTVVSSSRISLRSPSWRLEDLRVRYGTTPRALGPLIGVESDLLM